MNRLLTVVVLVIVLSTLVVNPVAADPIQGKNVIIVTEAVCEDGTTFDQVLIPGNSTVGLDVDSNVVGPALSLYAYIENDVDGERVEIFKRPGRGYRTVFCTWMQEGMLIGGDILLTPGGKP